MTISKSVITAVTALVVTWYPVHGLATTNAPAPDVLAQTIYHGKETTLKFQDLAVTIDREQSHDPKICESPTNTAAAASCEVPVARGEYDGQPVFEMWASGEAQDAEDGDWAPKLTLRRLDHSTPAPQVVFTYFTGGAHCCMATLIATATQTGQWQVVEAEKLDGDVGYRFVDLDHDGGSELIGHDDSFLYEFSSYAGSFPPTRILKLNNGHLEDVTKLPAYRPFLLQQLREMEDMARRNRILEPNGYLAGWVAEKSLVGQLDEAWRTMLQKYDRSTTDGLQECRIEAPAWNCPEDQQYVVPFPEALAIDLVKNGYLTSDESRKLGFDIAKIEADRAARMAAATEAYKIKQAAAWYVITNHGDCVEAKAPSSPAELITGDRALGLTDQFNILKTDDSGKPLEVRVAEPQSGNLETVYMFFRGSAECEAYRKQQKERIDQLK